MDAYGALAGTTALGAPDPTSMHGVLTDSYQIAVSIAVDSTCVCTTLFFKCGSAAMARLRTCVSGLNGTCKMLAVGISRCCLKSQMKLGGCILYAQGPNAGEYEGMHMAQDLPSMSMASPAEPQNVMDADGSLTALLVDPALNQPIQVALCAEFGSQIRVFFLNWQCGQPSS